MNCLAGLVGKILKILYTRLLHFPNWNWYMFMGWIILSSRVSLAFFIRSLAYGLAVYHGCWTISWKLNAL